MLMKCPICGGQRDLTHTSLVLQRHSVSYWKCLSCDFWGTQEPTWLDEAYDKAIAVTDTGLVARNQNLALRTPLLLRKMMKAHEGICVDWAGGYGLFVRLMRDKGFDFHWQDDYAENILAAPHVFREGQGPVSVVTAFEVFEHVPDPIAFVERIIRETACATIIFTTQLHDRSYDPTWWYLAPEAGQHISFFTERTLKKIGEKVNMNLYTRSGVHMLTSETISPWQYACYVKLLPRIAPYLRQPRESLTWSDHEHAVAELRSRT
jgi:methyltransferase family protein